MIEQNLISDKKISKSLTKMQTVSSDKRFRVKSLRMKTNNTQVQERTNSKLVLPSILSSKSCKVKTSILQKDFQDQLLKMNFTKDFLYKLYKIKSQQENVKPSQEKYRLFQRGIYYKLANKVQIRVQSFNFRQKALQMFLQWYLQFDTKTLSLDLSNCPSITQVKQLQEPNESNPNPIQTSNIQVNQKNWETDIIKKIILHKNNLVKLNLQNTKLNQTQIVQVLDHCLKSKRIYFLSLSNKMSSHLNRFGDNKQVLQYFLQANQSIGILKLDNLNLRDQGLHKICRGVIKNPFATLKILSISDNFLTQKSSQEVFLLTKSGITQLNLSNNELSPIFFSNMQPWRNGTIKILNLSNTSMNSQSLITFFGIIQDCKLLRTLIVDRNDFSNHWFNKINQKLAENNSIQQLSMSECNIKTFYPIFQGITYSKTLKKLNISHNVINVQDENLHKISQCFSINKTLQKVNIRYSGYKEGMLITIFEALKQNTGLRSLDISENNLSDSGAREIIKLLNQNMRINNIGLEKLQTSVRAKQQIQNLLKHNRKIRQKKQFNKLQKQTISWKGKDIYSWSQVQNMQNEQKKLRYNIQVLSQKNTKVQTKIAEKKQKIQELVKYFGQQIKKLDKEHRTLQRIQNQRIRNLQKIIANSNLTQNQLIQNCDIQQKLIANLEQKIKKQNQKIKKRQNQLQDLLRDKRYINKKKVRQSNESIDKKDSQTQKSPKLKKQKQKIGGLFDNTKSIIKLSKRFTNDKK